jgi:glycosyltransferase involved in cell wall biosynthesis
MATPKISVIIPAYNEELYLGRCIRSLLDQSVNVNEYELIIINDASDDNTQKIIDHYIDNIVLINNESNIGLPASLNKGILKAKGQYIVRVDADDYVHCEYLKVLSIHLKLNNDLDAVACDYDLVDDRQDLIKHVNCLKSPIGCGIMYRAEQLIEIGCYDENFRVREDEEMSIRFKKKYSLTRIPLPLYKYHLHDNNITSNLQAMNFYKDKLNQKHDR